MPYVYLIHAETTNRYKIGYSAAHPKGRMRALQIGSPVRLRIVDFREGTVADEMALHTRLYRFCSHGEWFEFDSEEDARRHFTAGHSDIRVSPVHGKLSSEAKREQIAIKFFDRIMGKALLLSARSIREFRLANGPLNEMWYTIADKYLEGSAMPSDEQIVRMISDNLPQQERSL